MKYLLFLALLLPYAALSKTTSLPLGQFRCAQNYGSDGFYVLSSADGKSQLFVYEHGTLKTTKTFDFEVVLCYPHQQIPIATIADTNRLYHLLKEGNSRAFPEGAFAIEVHPEANRANFWIAKPQDPEYLDVYFAELDSGAVVEKHNLPASALNHHSFVFSADGNRFALITMDGSRGTAVLDTKSLAIMNSYDLDNKMVSTAFFIGNNLLINFEGTVQLYQQQSLVWSYANPEIEISTIERSNDDSVLLLTNNVRVEFAVIDTDGREIINSSLKNRDQLKYGYELEQSYQIDRLMNDGFAIRSEDGTKVRIFNFNQEPLKTLNTTPGSKIFYPAKTSELIYELSKTNGKTTLSVF